MFLLFHVASKKKNVTYTLQKNMKQTAIPANKCMFKVRNRNTRAGCEICSKLTKKTPERHQRQMPLF